MSKYFICFLLLFGCSQGAEYLGTAGECEGYGDPGTAPYVLPFATGKEVTVSQGNCSSTSHFGVNRFAYDFAVPVGTEIRAARAGLVIGVKENLKDGNGCPDGNFVAIEHADKTVALYFHLTEQGALVLLQQRVKQGDVIARSGNTGCSGDAHLHFAVYSNFELTETLPVLFRNSGAGPTGHKSGDQVRGSNFEADSN